MWRVVAIVTARSVVSTVMIEQLRSLTAGQPIVFGGDRVTFVPDDLAARFAPGDRLVVVHDTGDLLHVPAAEHARATAAVDSALAAFEALGSCSDDQITQFFDVFADRLADDTTFDPIAAGEPRAMSSVPRPAVARRRGSSCRRRCAPT